MLVAAQSQQAGQRARLLLLRVCSACASNPGVAVSSMPVTASLCQSYTGDHQWMPSCSLSLLAHPGSMQPGSYNSSNAEGSCRQMSVTAGSCSSSCPDRMSRQTCMLAGCCLSSSHREASHQEMHRPASPPMGLCQGPQGPKLEGGCWYSQCP